jgi:hypothetical protein
LILDNELSWTSLMDLNLLKKRKKLILCTMPFIVSLHKGLFN